MNETIWVLMNTLKRCATLRNIFINGQTILLLFFIQVINNIIYFHFFLSFALWSGWIALLRCFQYNVRHSMSILLAAHRIFRLCFRRSRYSWKQQKTINIINMSCCFQRYVKVVTATAFVKYINTRKYTIV